jgi:hypothetical protein
MNTNKVLADFADVLLDICTAYSKNEVILSCRRSTPTSCFVSVVGMFAKGHESLDQVLREECAARTAPYIP